jgi:hypothetical protein
MRYRRHCPTHNSFRISFSTIIDTHWYELNYFFPAHTNTTNLHSIHEQPKRQNQTITMQDVIDASELTEKSAYSMQSPLSQ